MKDVRKLLVKVIECLLYRDFVSDYDGDGTKISDLVLVCFHINEKGVEVKTVLHNYSEVTSVESDCLFDAVEHA